MLDVILYRNGFNDHDRRLGIAAGLYHDLAIMPYSDHGKLLAPGSYEEEGLVRSVLTRSDHIPKRLAKHGIDIDELVDTIQGKGIVGRLLNSREGVDADNLSYLARDQILFAPTLAVKHTWIPPLDWGYEIYPKIFDQYNNLKHIDGEWVFNDPKLLVQLLRFRADMYKNVYHHPSSRAKEAFLIREFRDNKLKFDEVITWNDTTFERWFAETFGGEKFTLFFWTLFPPFRGIGREYDLTRLESLRAEREKDHVVVEHLKPPRDAVRNHVLHNGEVKLLEDIPEFAEEVERVRADIRRLNYVGFYMKGESEFVEGC